MNQKSIPKITVMYCINSFSEKAELRADLNDQVDLQFLKLACSSMVKDVYLLRAFEAGSDAVIVFVCPEGHCRYVEGNIRAKKRIAWVQNLLNEIGLDGRRLKLFHLSTKDAAGAQKMIGETLTEIGSLGLSPAR